jgi:multiple sugar transport system substrate-binding protein
METIRFAYLTGGGLEYQSLVEQFQEQNPYITIDLQEISFTNRPFNDIVEELLTSGDVIRLNSFALSPEMIANLRSLDEYIPLDPSFPNNDLLPGSLEALQWDNKQVGIPAGIAPLVMMYENMRFTIAEATPPEANYTLDDFLTAALAVNNQDESSIASGEFAYGYCTGPVKEDILIYTYLFGGGVFDRLPNPTEPTLNRPENVDALEWYARLWSDYQVVPPISSNPNEFFGFIYNALCGFYMGWYYQLGFIAENAQDLRILPLPTVKAPLNIAVLDGYFMTTASPNPEAAWKWISFLVSQPSATGKQISPLMSVIASEEYKNSVSPDVLAIARGLTSDLIILGLDYGQGEEINQVLELFSQAVNQVVQDGVDAQTALDEAQERAEELFP